MASGANNHGPVRIELASSELGGGSTLAWVDPQQVLACVAQVDSRETFSRFLEPRLAGIDTPLAEGATEGQNGLPLRIQCLLERLRQTHSRLYRENRARGASARFIRPVLASLEDGTVYFVKGAPCWVFRVRDGASELIRAGGDPSATGSDDGGLGRSPRLHLAVSSVEVQPNDTVVLLAAEGGAGPDRVAVSGVFKEGQDLKRACDGLVNLFSLTSSGVGAVAMRFVAVGTRQETARDGIGLVEDLERELVKDGLGASEALTGPTPTTKPSSAASTAEEQDLEEFVLPDFLESAGKPFASPGGPLPEPLVSHPEMEASGEAEAGVVDLPSTATGETAGERPGATPELVNTATPPRRSSVEADDANRKRSRSAAWVAAVAVVIAALVGVIGLPRAIHHFRGGGLAEGGVLRIDSTPPARAIFIDDVDQETGSPAILEGVAAGNRRVRLDLGAFGAMEVGVHVRTGQTLDLRPTATGSLMISAIDSRPGAVVWLSGRERQALPCKIDSLPAGWQEVFYEDDRFPLWQRQVPILAGEVSSLRINNSFAPDQALLRVESWAYRQGKGLHAASGDTVLVDRRYFGTTPLEKEIQPGLHGVCVVGPEGLKWTEVLDLPAGSSRVVAPRFGLEAWPRIEHQEPGRILLRGTVPLTASITCPDGTPPRNPRLHFPTLDATVRDLPLSPVDPASGIYVGMVDPRWIPLNESVMYYFTVQTAEGQTLCSELYRLTGVGEISEAIQH
jgi:hypothetical protein